MSNRTLQSNLGDSEFVQLLQKEPPEQRRGIENSPPHTLHVIQQEKLKRKETKETSGQTSRQEEEDPELERLVNRARLTTTAQFYDKDEKAGLTEIGPTGPPTTEGRPKNKQKERPEMEPIVEDIPPWSRKSLKQHAGKVKEMLTLLQQGNDKAEIFIGNNTRERNRKKLVTGMLQDHLQKIGNVTL